MADAQTCTEPLAHKATCTELLRRAAWAWHLRRALAEIDEQTCAEHMCTDSAKQQLARSTTSRRAIERSHSKRATCTEKSRRSTAPAQSNLHIGTCGRRCAEYLQSCNCTKPSLQVLLLMIRNTRYRRGAVTGGLNKDSPVLCSQRIIPWAVRRRAKR